MHITAFALPERVLRSITFPETTSETDASGTQAIPNRFAGIQIRLGASENTIGGNVEGSGNLISGNVQHGINITNVDSSGNVIIGNFIGTDSARPQRDS